jgi:hypothetical protein
MAKKLTVTAPDGTVLTRKTDRTYTHAILVRRSYENALARASKPSAVDGENWQFHLEMGAGTHELAQKKSWQTEERHAAELAGHKARADQYSTREAAIEGERQARIAAIEALKKSGHFDRWGALTWCGRPDLAAKELAKAQADASNADVRAVQVAA